MLSKEDLAAVISYCQENALTYKDGMKEFGIPEHVFYRSKRRYMEEEKQSACGEFLQLTPGSEMVSSPLSQLRAGGKDRTGKAIKNVSSKLNIELKTPSGILMRVSGEMTGDMPGVIIRNISGNVQS